jgi:hypothetical protein
MGMPRKGSRKVEVDGATFLWRVRGDSYSRQWLGTSPVVLTLTCQRDDEKPGRVMQATLKSLNPPEDTPDYAPGHRATLHPADVEQIITHALSKGWDPAERGGAFELEPRAHQPRPAAYEIVQHGTREPRL